MSFCHLRGQISYSVSISFANGCLIIPVTYCTILIWSISDQTTQYLQSLPRCHSRSFFIWCPTNCPFWEFQSPPADQRCFFFIIVNRSLVIYQSLSICKRRNRKLFAIFRKIHFADARYDIIFFRLFQYYRKIYNLATIFYLNVLNKEYFRPWHIVCSPQD